MNSKAVGELTEGIILAALLRKGFSVSLPFGNNQRYDLIVDNGERLLRAQCKTGHLVKGCISFAVASKNGFTGQRKPYHGQVDVFLVYCPSTDQVYQVPVSDDLRNEMRLRIDPLLPSAPVSKIRWAKDFTL